MNWFLLGRAFKYFLFSRHKKGHGIHSPFLYKLITEDFLNNPARSVVKGVERYRSDLRSRKEIIEINDPGTGSLRNNRTRRKVSNIARYSSLRPKYGSLLTALSGRSSTKNIVELGTSLGIGTTYMALARPDCRIYTIEECRSRALIAGENLAKHGIENVEQLVGNLDEQLEYLLNRIESPGMFFVNSNHSGKAILSYFDMIHKYANNESIIVFNGIHKSREMEDAWKRIIEMDIASLSVDLFRLGLIFLKEGMVKQSFVVRY